MRYFLSALAMTMLLGSAAGSLAQGPTYNRGRAPTADEIRKWDIDIDMEGKGLPPGRGNAQDGAAIFAQKCVVCHGKGGEGGMAKALMGGKGSLTSPKPVKTIGSFWPYATTLWDFINRAMPETQPGSLTVNEVYSLTAYLLFRNQIIQENQVIDAATLPKIQMPNRNGFTPELPTWKPGMKRQLGYYPNQ